MLKKYDTPLTKNNMFDIYLKQTILFLLLFESFINLKIVSSKIIKLAEFINFDVN